jgi:hypothetical protein
VTSSYLDPVATVWVRIAGVALLIAGAVLTVVLGYALFEVVAQESSRRALTSSSLIFALILLALCGICWQAGYRLAFRRPDRSGMIFSRPAWFAIGTGLVVLTALMAGVILAARRPTLVDYQVILFLGAIGVWCLVLAFRRLSQTRQDSYDTDR